jgi:hypothetical protein
MTDLSNVSDSDLFASLPRTPENFAAQYGGVAQRVGQQIGVDPSVLLGQWGHETGWGKSIIPGTNNLGNIKGKGPAARDNMTGSTDTYASYASPDDFGNAYAGLIQRKYPGAMNTGSNAQAFAKGLRGYAEDPSYVDKLVGAVKSLPQAVLNRVIPSAQAQETAQPDISQASNEDLAQAAGIDLSQVPTADLAQAAGITLPKPQQRSFVDEMGHQLGLTARAVGHGVADAAGVIANPLNAAVNTVGGWFGANPHLQDVDTIIRNQVDRHTPAPDNATESVVNDIAAGVANPINLAMGALPATGVVKGALLGAAGGANRPVHADTDLGSYAAGVGTGALVGGALGAAQRAIGGLTPNPQAQQLIDRGVEITPGQALGGYANRVEEAAQSAPLAGIGIRKGRQNAVESFNRTMYQDALSPIGKSLPDSVPTGSDAIEHVASTIGQQYDDLARQASFTPRGIFWTAARDIRADLSQTAPAALDQFDNIVQNQISRKLNGGTMSGSHWNATRSFIATQARNNRMGQTTPDQRALANALDELNDAINTQVARQAPSKTFSTDLRAANSAWARYKRVERAAGAANASNNGNVFTPAQYSQSVRQQSTRFQRATNSGLNADIATAAQQVIGNKVPDSGTTERYLLLHGLGALGTGGAGWLTGTLVPVLAAGGAGFGLYGTDAGRRAMMAALFSRPDVLRQIAGGVGATTPGIASGAAGLLAGNQ